MMLQTMNPWFNDFKNIWMLKILKKWFFWKYKCMDVEKWFFESVSKSCIFRISLKWDVMNKQNYWKETDCLPLCSLMLSWMLFFNFGHELVPWTTHARGTGSSEHCHVDNYSPINLSSAVKNHVIQCNEHYKIHRNPSSLVLS